MRHSLTGLFSSRRSMTQHWLKSAGCCTPRIDDLRSRCERARPLIALFLHLSDFLNAPTPAPSSPALDSLSLSLRRVQRVSALRATALPRHHAQRRARRAARRARRRDARGERPPRRERGRVSAFAPAFGRAYRRAVRDSRKTRAVRRRIDYSRKPRRNRGAKGRKLPRPRGAAGDVRADPTSRRTCQGRAAPSGLSSAVLAMR